MSIETLPHPLPHEISPDLRKHLSRVAVLHALESSDAPEEPAGFVDLPTEEELPHSEKYLQRATDAGSHESIEPTADAAEKQQTLEAIRSALMLGAEAHRDRESEGEQVNWADAANTLYDLAADATDERQRDTLQVSAIVASQFAPDNQARVDLLKR